MLTNITTERPDITITSWWKYTAYKVALLKIVYESESYEDLPVNSDQKKMEGTEEHASWYNGIQPVTHCVKLCRSNDSGFSRKEYNRENL